MSLIDHAKAELAAINFGVEDSRVMIELMERFFDQWDSGGAVSVALPVFQRLVAGKPLSPLTGEDVEWFIHDKEGCYAQNLRCPTVFKATKDGPAYNIDDPERRPITFPYWPEKAEVKMPIYDI